MQDAPVQSPTPVIVTGGGKIPAGNKLIQNLHRRWTLASRSQKLAAMSAVAIVLLTATGFALYAWMHQAKPVVNKPVTVAPTQGTGQTTDPTKKDETTDKKTTTKKSTSKKSSGGSSGGGSSGGGSSGGGGSGGGSSSCALPDYPDASCTGVPAGTSLTVVNGDMTISTADTVIEGKDIRGCVEVTAPGVIIRKSKIVADCFYVIKSHGVGGTWLLIEDSEISCDDNSGTGVGDSYITIRRANIHGCENGLDVDGYFDIQDSYIHDLYNGPGAHSDGIQTNNGGTNITIKHNTIYSDAGTSSIILHDNGADNTVIRDNLLAGGAYTLYCARPGASSNFDLINNHFSTKFFDTVGDFGPWTDCDDDASVPGNQVTGNVYHESGDPVPL